MRTEGIELIPNGGLKVSTTTFARLKAFQGGGDYWDHQDLIRESLGQFLPTVQQVQETDERFGVFRKNIAGKEVLWKSIPVGVAQVPQQEILRLTAALEAFKRKADAPDTQPNARNIIQQFRLPDISKDPDLYRLCGPWWDRKLQVLWGCERIPDSSLAPVAAIAKLPVDRTYVLKRAISLFTLLVLLCALLAACIWGWPALRLWTAKAFNKPPVAALRLDFLDETNRIAVISDNGSADPDGVLKHWYLAWGDGKQDPFTEPPRQARHIYDSERNYTISLWCVDNYGATSSPPALTNISFALIKREKAFEQAQLAGQREAERIKKEAKKEADQLKEDAKKQQDLAAQQSAQAQHDSEAAEQKLREAKELAESVKTNTPVAQAPPATNSSPAIPESTPAQQPPAQQSSNIQPEDPPLSGEAPSPTQPAKGAQALMFRNLEILKAGVGHLSSDNTVEAMLVVRDKSHANASLDVIEWVVDGKAYRTGNAQFTTRLAIAEHVVSVKVRHLGIEQTAKARVVVTGAQTQTTEPDFTISPLR